MLRKVMDANNLRQKDLVPIFGSESIVSEVLHKKRALNKTHIEKLSKRFHVSPAVFFSRTTDRKQKLEIRKQKRDKRRPHPFIKQTRKDRPPALLHATLPCVQ